ncbi:MAG: DNA primase [Ruminococcus sp.]|nr:DNA primase [Ruminococcus sp.]
MAFPQDFIDRLKYANKIEDVMGSYVSLKRASSTFKCLCPFHSERTPSCTVYPETDSFYCFGCGAGGDVVTFIMKIENLDYYEAVKFLAERSGIPLPEDSYRGNGADVKKKRLYEINKQAARFFYSNLKKPEGKKGLTYLLGRGLKLETIKKFGLGVALDNWSALRDHLLSLGFYENELVEASLITKNQQGRTFDFFKNRVMFPFFDIRGNVVAFGGRRLDESDSRKYLNSRETAVFKKNKTLFALNFAKDSSVKKKQILLCEGNLDVISLHQAGFDNAIATCGTALTSDHARILLQYCDEVVICYDSDEAGQKASKKAINTLSEVGLKTKVINMEGAKDPDEFINKFGSVRFQKLIDKSEGAILYELSKAKSGLDLKNPLDKIDYLKGCYPVLEKISDPVEREVYIDSVSLETGVSKDEIKNVINQHLKSRQAADKKRSWRNQVNSTVVRKDELNPLSVKYPKAAKAEEGIISYIYAHPDKCAEICSMISADDFVTDLNKRIFSSVSSKISAGIDYSTFSLGSEFSADEMGKISKIIADGKKVTLDNATVLDFIKVIKSTKTDDTPMDISNDDELLQYMNSLK